MNTKQKALLSATSPNTVPHHSKLVLLRKGTVNFFNTGKGYGSVRDSLTRQDYIVYKAFLARPSAHRIT